MITLKISMITTNVWTWYFSSIICPTFSRWWCKASCHALRFSCTAFHHRNSSMSRLWITCSPGRSRSNQEAEADFICTKQSQYGLVLNLISSFLLHFAKVHVQKSISSSFLTGLVSFHMSFASKLWFLSFSLPLSFVIGLKNLLSKASSEFIWRVKLKNNLFK